MNKMPYTDKRGRAYKYGEFFPIELSIFCYSERSVQDFLPLSKEDVKKLGFNWKDEEEKHHKVTTRVDALPDHIKDAKYSLTEDVIECNHNGTCNHRCTQAFRIAPNEIMFYKKMNIPLPRLYPNCRHYERFRSRNSFKLWHRKCMCDPSTSSGQATSYTNTTTHFHGEGQYPNEFETSYTLDQPETIYCEACYQAEMV